MTEHTNVPRCNFLKEPLPLVTFHWCKLQIYPKPILPNICWLLTNSTFRGPLPWENQPEFSPRGGFLERKFMFFHLLWLLGGEQMAFDIGYFQLHHQLNILTWYIYWFAREKFTFLQVWISSCLNHQEYLFCLLHCITLWGRFSNTLG